MAKLPSGYVIIGTIMPVAAKQKNLYLERVAVRSVASWLFVSGLVSIAGAIVEVQEASRASVLYFGSNTALLSQHGILTGITLLYISRHLWRGEHRAWQIALLLISLEVVKYLFFTPQLALFLLYSLTAAIMVWCQSWFDRRSDDEELRRRLLQFLLVVVAVVGILIVGIMLLELKQRQGLFYTSSQLVALVRHLLWIDTDGGDSLVRHLLGQVVNVAGLGLFLTLVVSLFRPRRAPRHTPSAVEQAKVIRLLNRHGQSDEDYFKLWPQPKRYFWNGPRTAFITYDVVGHVAFALGHPVGSSALGRRRCVQSFVAYCRRNGWCACFILLNEQQKSLYQLGGLKLFRIGATAKVSVKTFAEKTITDKWWRWVLNKSDRQHMQYMLAVPPHSTELLADVRVASDAWLARSGHGERGFAMGYYDSDYLQQCRLHLLTQHGRVIAFANELPRYNSNLTVTIDLMRYLPDADHAMPILLASTIRQLHTEAIVQNFDLGFVPLAGNSTKSEQAIKRLSQFFIRETIPSSGLEQFKNKFDPAWQNTYIAFDGDWLDLVHISRFMDKLLRP